MQLIPTIVIVPGTWCTASLYSPLVNNLRKLGYKVHIVDLPSTEQAEYCIWTTEDVEKTRSILKDVADDGEDIVVLAHSEGGFTACEAAKGLSKIERRNEAIDGGVVSMAFIAAFVPEAGMRLVDYQHGCWESPNPDTVRDIFFNDVDPAIAAQASKLLVPNAMVTRQFRVTNAAWKRIPCSYLMCEKDRWVRMKMQEGMVKKEGTKFEVERCDAGHFPWMSRQAYPEVLAFVRRASGEEL